MAHRNTEVISFSVLPHEARLIKKTAKAMHKNLSDFLRAAAKQTAVAYQWRSWCCKGEKSARRFRISIEDVEAAIDELRT